MGLKARVVGKIVRIVANIGVSRVSVGKVIIDGLSVNINGKCAFGSGSRKKHIFFLCRKSHAAKHCADNGNCHNYCDKSSLFCH